MTEGKRKYLYDEMRSAGFQRGEAELYLKYNDRCNFESITRRWRKQADEADKNREMEAEYKEEYTPVSHSSLKLQEKLDRAKKHREDNGTLF